MGKSKKTVLRTFAKCEGCIFLKTAKKEYSCKKGRKIDVKEVGGLKLQPKPAEKCEKTFNA